jgi:hypothetical protein
MPIVFVPLLKKLVGIFSKLRQAVLAAKVICLSVLLLRPGSALWIHGHAADWIGDHTRILPLILSRHRFHKQSKGGRQIRPSLRSGAKDSIVAQQISYFIRTHATS